MGEGEGRGDLWDYFKAVCLGRGNFTLYGFIILDFRFIFSYDHFQVSFRLCFLILREGGSSKGLELL